MTKIWTEAFWKPRPTDRPLPPTTPSMARLIAPVAVLAAVTLAIGLYAEPLVVLAERSASELLAPTAYIEAVLGSGAASPPTAATPH
jgi:multicomponent Na+:H+ antiporter subunit D